jgi:hydrogenase expression/formation protein HypC
MCVAIPVKISKIKDGKAEVDGKTINISLIPDVKVGDWILCHSGLAVNKIPSNDAQKILELNKSCEHGTAK